MTARGWRRVAFALALGCVLLAWRGRGGEAARQERREPDPERALSREREALRLEGAAASGRAHGDGAADRGGEAEGTGEGGSWEEAEEPPPPEPHWLWRFFRPREDETMLDYRDRVLPVVQAAVAPQRRRVAVNRDQFIAEADLDADQIAAIDAAVDGATEAIVTKVFDGVFSGELMPPNLRPMTGVAFTRDVLDEVVRADAEVRAVLDDRQRRLLDEGAFDVADYLFFSTRWEDLFGVAP